MFTNYQTFAQHIPENNQGKQAKYKAEIDISDVFGTVYFTASLSDDGVYSDISIDSMAELIGINDDGEETFILVNNTLAETIEKLQDRLQIEQVQ